jgi:RNA polymerase sigma factor (sigma-70 family)
METLSSASEAEIIEKAKKQDPDAIRYLYERYHRYAINLARRNSHTREDAEDIAAETMTTAFLKIDQYIPGMSFLGWLRVIGIRKSIDYKRRNYCNSVLHEELHLAKQQPSCDRTDSHLDLQETIDEAFSSLSGDQLRYLKLVAAGFDPLEISQFFGKNHNTVKSIVFRARVKAQKSQQRSA